MSGPQINRINWTKERISAYRKYLAGDSDATFRGRKPNGDFWKKTVRVSTLIGKYSGYKFSVKKGDVVVTGGQHGSRKILTDDQVRTKAIALFRHKETGLGRAPSVYQYMNTKYVNVSYKKVEKAIQSLAAYQKYSARHVKKPTARKVIVSVAPGEQIDTDIMYFSTGYYRPSQNEGFDGLCIVVDRFSGYIAVSPLLHGKKKKTAQIVADKTADLINSAGFPRARNGTIFHDNGSEYQEIFPDKMRQIGYKDVVVSQAAGAPSAHAERAVGVLRALINTKLTSRGTKPKKHTQRWWPLARTLARSYNETPLTDARAPHSPNQLKVMNSRKRNPIIKAMMAAGFKRVQRVPSRMVDGARIPKNLKILSVGDRVRYALENIRKTGASKRPYPKQRWSDAVLSVVEVIKRKLGFASFVLQGLPKRRFEREDLQKISSSAPTKSARGKSSSKQLGPRLREVKVG